MSIPPLEFNDLNVLDPPDVDQTEFGPDMKRWLANIVDIVNFNFIILQEVSFYFENLIETKGIDIGGSGISVNIPVMGLTANGYVSVNIISTTNPDIEVVSITPNLNSFNVTFNNNPGVSAIIVYKAFISKFSKEI